MLARSLGRWAAALITLLLLAGCSGLPGRRAEPVPVRPGAEPEKADFITIRITVDPDSPDPALDALLTAFQNQHPRYRVDKVPLKASLLDTAFRDKVLKGEVDLFSATGLLGVWTHEGKNPAADLMPFVQKSQFDLKPYSPVFTELSFRGRLLELPWAVRPNLLVANAALLQQAQVRLPKESWTWDEFLAAARQVVKGTGDEKVWGLPPYQAIDLAQVQVAEAKQAGRPDEDAVADVLRLVAGLIQAGTMDGMPQAMEGTTTVPDYFGLGRAGFTLLTPEKLYGANPPEFEWRVLPMPMIPGSKPFTPVHLASYAIAEASPNQEAAWELLSFMTGPEAALVVSRMGVLPYRLSPEAKAAYMAVHPQLPPEVAGALDTDWVTYPYYLEGQSRQALLWMATRQVLEREKTWEEALAEYKTGVAKLKGAQ